MVHFFSFRVLALTALAAATLAAGAACSGGDDDGGDAKAPATVASSGTTAPAASGDSAAASTGADKVEIDMKDNVFATKEIAVKSGSTVTFDIKNTGQAIHNVHILSQQGEGKDYMSDAMINPGKSDSLEVKFTKKGTYKFQCDYHVPDMVGTITVS